MTPESELERRRKRALFRASHRGTREMDFLLGGFAAARVAAMTAAALGRFEDLLAVGDPDLQAWILDRASQPDAPHQDLIEVIRAFHDVA